MGARVRKVEVREVDRGWKQLLQTVRALKTQGTHVKVGVLDDGAGADAHGNLTTAELAAVHNYGTERIPARPFITGTFEKYREQYIDKLAVLLKKVYEGKISVVGALDVMGAIIATDMKKEVTTGDNFAPNAASTIAAKGSSKPLIDTGRLVNAVSWAVVTFGGKKL